MKDFLGQEIKQDDEVIIRTPSYSSICKGKVIAFTPRKVRIQYTNDWNFGKPGVVQDILIDPWTIYVLPKGANSPEYEAGYAQALLDAMAVINFIPREDFSPEAIDDRIKALKD